MSLSVWCWSWCVCSLILFGICLLIFLMRRRVWKGVLAVLFIIVICCCRNIRIVICVLLIIIIIMMIIIRWCCFIWCFGILIGIFIMRWMFFGICWKNWVVFNCLKLMIWSVMLKLCKFFIKWWLERRVYLACIKKGCKLGYIIWRRVVWLFGIFVNLWLDSLIVFIENCNYVMLFMFCFIVFLFNFEYGLDVLFCVV